MQDPIEARIRRVWHDNPLGQRGLAICTPLPDLAALVETAWLGEGSVSHQRERILPSGGSQLLSKLGPPQYLFGDATSGERRVFADI